MAKTKKNNKKTINKKTKKNNKKTINKKTKKNNQKTMKKKTKKENNMIYIIYHLAHLGVGRTMILIDKKKLKKKIKLLKKVSDISNIVYDKNKKNALKKYNKRLKNKKLK